MPLALRHAHHVGLPLASGDALRCCANVAAWTKAESALLLIAHTHTRPLFRSTSPSPSPSRARIFSFLSLSRARSFSLSRSRPRPRPSLCRTLLTLFPTRPSVEEGAAARCLCWARARQRFAAACCAYRPRFILCLPIKPQGPSSSSSSSCPHWSFLWVFSVAFCENSTSACRGKGHREWGEGGQEEEREEEEEGLGAGGEGGGQV